MTILISRPVWRSRMLCLIFMLFNSAFAHATDHAIVTWRCWPADSNIECLLAPALLETAAITGPASTDLICLPESVQGLRTDPEASRGELVIIPMHTTPIDMEFVAELALASMCGGQVDCTVQFTRIPPDLDEMDDLTI